MRAVSARLRGRPRKSWPCRCSGPSCLGEADCGGYVLTQVVLPEAAV